MKKRILKIVSIAVLAAALNGCFFTKLATVPIRLVGAAGNVVGSVVSIIPVVGNEANEALYDLDGAMNEVADKIDKIPI